jgi:DNA polymerase III subunit delta
MPTLRALELDSRVAELASLPVCAVVGEDESLAARSMLALEHAAAPMEQPGSSVRRVSGKSDAYEAFDELRTIPFMGMTGRRVVVVEDGAPWLKVHAERVLDWLTAPVPSSTLIVRVPKLDKRRKLFKALAQSGLVVECSRLRWNEAKQWADTVARGLGKRLEPRAASALIEAVGVNVLAIQTELEKLAAFVGEDRRISERAVGEIVAHGRARSVFDMVNAVGAADLSGALRLCGDLLLRGERREVIIALLARQVRQLWSVKRLLDKRMNMRDAARQLRMQEWMVERAARSCRSLPEAWFMRQLELLADADYESKTTSLHAGEETVWMEATLARLCRA